MTSPALDDFAVQRAMRAAQAHAFGKTWEDVAHEQGYPSATAARLAASRMMKKYGKEAAANVRWTIAMRLNRMFEIIAPAIESGDLWAMDRGLEITRQYRALFGADKPAKDAQAAIAAPVIIEVQAGVGEAI